MATKEELILLKQEIQDLRNEIRVKQRQEIEIENQIEHEKMLDDWEMNLFAQIHKSYQERRLEEVQRIQKLYDAELGMLAQAAPEPKKQFEIRWGSIIGDIAAIAMIVLFVVQAIR